MIMDWLMKAVLVAAAGWTPSPVNAASDTIREPLTLEEVVAAALATHPEVEGARARWVAAEAGAGQARSEWWPTVAVRGSGTQYEEPMVVAPLHGFDPRNPPAFDETLYQGHASAEYTVYDGGARGARVRAAAARADAAGSAVVAARDAVLAEVVSAYLEALSAREVRRAHAYQVDALGSERRRTALFLEEGKAPRVAVLRSEAALSEARAGLEAADERLRLALRRLARVSGLPAERVASAALEPVGTVAEPALDRDRLVARARSANPGLLEARDQLVAAATAVSAARATFLPRVGLTGRYSAFGSASTDPVTEWQAGVEVRYPVFTGGSRRHGVERAAALKGAAEAGVRQAERTVADGVDAALLGYRSARARVTALEAAVAQMGEVARIEALALEAGAGVQTDYLQAQAALLRSRAGLAEARHAVVEARVRLARVTGELDEAWLARITGEVER